MGMEITDVTQVAEIALRHPASVKVFERHGIDFCCGGKKPLAEACAERGVPLAAVKADLSEALVAPPDETRDWASAPLGELIQHILERYHAPLKQDLPQLGRMSQKVADVHGGRHPELKRMAQIYAALWDELDPHMQKEEQILFPFLATLEGPGAGRHPLMGAAEHPIGMMRIEHESAGAALADLRQLSGGYQLPDDACNTWRGLYHGLEQMERELHEHIHLENNALFPRALEVESRLLQGGRPLAPA